MLADSDIWPSPSSDMYRPHCNHSVKRFGGIYCLSVVGWLFTIVFTYLGFACMILGELLPDLKCSPCALPGILSCILKAFECTNVA